MTVDYLVHPMHACPKCGERDMDALVWQDDDVVLCGECGTTYYPCGDRDDVLSVMPYPSDPAPF